VVVGTIVGLVNGNTVEAFTGSVQSTDGNFLSVFSGIAAAAFAYEGWSIATSINAELKNPKKNLPIALVVGTAIIGYNNVGNFRIGVFAYARKKLFQEFRTIPI
jgi:APA family basic amino acid/polyamine antiporter